MNLPGTHSAPSFYSSLGEAARNVFYRALPRPRESMLFSPRSPGQGSFFPWSTAMHWPLLRGSARGSAARLGPPTHAGLLLRRYSKLRQYRAQRPVRRRWEGKTEGAAHGKSSQPPKSPEKRTPGEGRPESTHGISCVPSSRGPETACQCPPRLTGRGQDRPWACMPRKDSLREAPG